MSTISRTYNAAPTLAKFHNSNAPYRLIRGPVGCLAGDSRIVTTEGWVEIRHLTPDMRVLSWDAEARMYAFVFTSGGFIKGRAKLYCVTHSNGTFRAAAHHRVLLRSGEYRAVCELKSGDCIAVNPSVECVDGPSIRARLTQAIRSLRGRIARRGRAHYYPGSVSPLPDDHFPDTAVATPPEYSYVSSVVEGPEEEDFWDVQVPDTNNYITTDGAVHHNSGKSVAAAIEILRRACEMPPGPDGVRRSRGVVVRNTLQQLKSTSLVTILEWLRPISTWKVSEATLTLAFTPPDGIPVICDVLLLPLDTPQNKQRLLSLELTFAWVSEFREIPLEIMQDVYSRCGRYPSRANVKSYWHGIWGETNSFSEDSEYYEYLEVDKPELVDYFVQPGGMEPDAENRENLPPRYYEDMLETNTPEWCSQYVHNQITASLSGQAVFAKVFHPKFHVTENELHPDYGRPIVIGLDTGRNPAAVTGQVDSRGRLLVFSSLFAENMGMEQFLTTRLQPHLMARFQGGMFWIAVDPAARQRSQIGEESVLEAIRRLGFSVVLAPTNDISPRLRAVERYMGMQIGGGAGFLIDKAHSSDLLRAVQYDYRYKRQKSGDLTETPEKNHPASDLCDGLQYLCLSIGSNVIARALRATIKVAPKPAVGAWT